MKKTLILVTLLLIPWSLLAEDAFVRGMRVYLLEDATIRAERLTQIKRGEKLFVINRERIFSQVIYNGQNGWVLNRLLSSQPIKKRVSILASNKDIKSFARKRASSYSSTAAARGLTKSGSASVNRTNAASEQQLLSLESQQIDPEAAFNFIQNEK